MEAVPQSWVRSSAELGTLCQLSPQSWVRASAELGTLFRRVGYGIYRTEHYRTFFRTLSTEHLPEFSEQGALSFSFAGKGSVRLRAFAFSTPRSPTPSLGAPHRVKWVLKAFVVCSEVSSPSRPLKRFKSGPMPSPAAPLGQGPLEPTKNHRPWVLGRQECLNLAAAPPRQGQACGACRALDGDPGRWRLAVRTTGGSENQALQRCSPLVLVVVQSAHEQDPTSSVQSGDRGADTRLGKIGQRQRPRRH